MGVVMVPIIDINYLVVGGGDLCSSFPLYCLYHVLPCSNALGNGHTVWSANHECNTDTGKYYYCGNWPYHDHILLFVEDHSLGFYLCMSLITLEVGFAVVTVLITVTLICTSVKSVILELTWMILRSLASALLCEASELSATTLTIKRSLASTLTWGSVIIIMVIIIGVIIGI